MKQISERRILEYKYDSEEDRSTHVKWMESLGFVCSGQVKRSDDSLWDDNRTYYWYAKFEKQF